MYWSTITMWSPSLPKTIAESLPSLLDLAVKDYTRIAEEEREAVKRTQFELHNPAWLRIKSGKYRGNVAQVFEHLPNSVVAVLVVARRFPYSMPQGSQALIERSRLPNNTTVSDIIWDDKVVGWKYKGESYYMEHIASSHADDIRLHLDSRWNKPFIQATLAAFSLQFLRIGDWARVVKGSLRVCLQDVERVFRVGDTVRVVASSYLGLQGHIIEMHGDTFQVCQDTTNEQVKVSRYYLDRRLLKHTVQSWLPMQQYFNPPKLDSIEIARPISHFCTLGASSAARAHRRTHLRFHRSSSVYPFHVRSVHRMIIFFPHKHWTLSLKISVISANRHKHQFSYSNIQTSSYLSPDSLKESQSTFLTYIGDYIEVMEGEHMGKRGVVDWFSKKDTNLWFRDIFIVDNTECSGGLSSISVPAAIVQRTSITQTIQFTKERGYDVRPGDVVTVARGPEYEAKGVVQSIDFPNACLTLLCDGDHALINVPIGFVVKLQNADLDCFKHIGQEVFVIWGEYKGYRGTLHGIGHEACVVALRGQKCTSLKLYDTVTKFMAFRFGMRLNGAMLEGSEWSLFCELRKRSYLAPPPRSITPPIEKDPSSSSGSITGPILPSSNAWPAWSASSGGADVVQSPLSSTDPNSSTPNAWTVDELDIQNSVDARSKKNSDSGSLPWLMTREFASKCFTYHAMLKVSPIFDASLSKRFVSTPCPDPFCSENGPAPEGCVAAYCTSNNTGAITKHYHIPAIYLSPAPPRKKNQECLILDGTHRGLVGTVARCSIKHSFVDISITPTVTTTLHFDQICLVEPMQ
ncbi:uncharacterized protein F5147DRAFT_650196 [Suillus discolor]|uniref:KOW domain-containing protein n=1 Tax=Suillus discolor TaxID=1912936 RepID=A0A9P7FDJ6_9AGAM|nr:uncharacterized protein F5147DRAFT_650196 [Suillus discolor]KAG2113777.1 hypothetical protein F5147DRAFT_650196 [Suillus discolor]